MWSKTNVPGSPRPCETLQGCRRSRLVQCYMCPRGNTYRYDCAATSAEMSEPQGRISGLVLVCLCKQLSRCMHRSVFCTRSCCSYISSLVVVAQRHYHLKVTHVHKLAPLIDKKYCPSYCVQYAGVRCLMYDVACKLDPHLLHFYALLRLFICILGNLHLHFCECCALVQSLSHRSMLFTSYRQVARFGAHYRVPSQIFCTQSSTICPL